MKFVREEMLNLWSTLSEPIFVLGLITLLLQRKYLEETPNYSDSLYGALITALDCLPEDLTGRRGRYLVQDMVEQDYYAKGSTPPPWNAQRIRLVGRGPNDCLVQESPFAALKFSGMVTALQEIDWRIWALKSHTQQYRELLHSIRASSKKRQVADSDFATNEHPVTSRMIKLLSGSLKDEIFADVSGPGPDGAGGACIFGLDLLAITLYFFDIVDSLTEAAWKHEGAKDAMSRIYGKNRGYLSNSLLLKRADLLAGLLASAALGGGPGGQLESCSGSRSFRSGSRCNFVCDGPGPQL
ncbi:hypothetical protein V8F33_005843 [Rhypophila sp. PSN 637]